MAFLPAFLAATVLLTSGGVSVSEFSTSVVRPVEPPNLAEPAAPLYDERYILHAGGLTPNGVRGSNSLEALEESYRRGYRVFELDFCWTQDGYLACVHDWDGYYGVKVGKKAPTLAEFESMRRGTYGFTSLSVEEVAAFLEGHPDARVVTDIKTDNVKGAAQLAQRCPGLLGQFIIQIYAPGEYDQVRALGFDNLIYTVYQLPYGDKTDTRTLADFMRTHTLVGCTFSDELAALPGYVAGMLAGETPLFVHTVNDPDRQAELFAMGVSGVYTDVGDAAR